MEPVNVNAVAVQAFDDPSNRDRVTDFGWYCELCITEGVRRWMLDERRDGDLRLIKGTAFFSDDPLRCAGCGRGLASGT